MCAHLGIRHAYSQAYRPQANGRAEVAGKQLFNILRKLHCEERVNWVEALPRVLMLIHDVKSEASLSPHEFFGMFRYICNLPYEPPRECEDSNEFWRE